MNEQQKKSVKSIYDGYTFWVNSNLERIFSSAISNDRVFESCKSLIYEEVYKGEARNIDILQKSTVNDVKISVHNDANSIIGRVLRVAEMTICCSKLEALKPLVTNIVWKNVDTMVFELRKVFTDEATVHIE